MRSATSTTPKMEFSSAYPVYIDPGFHFVTHAHAFHELVVIQQGQFRVRASGKEHIVNHGDVLFYTAGTVHEEWADNDAPVITWACSFEGIGFGHNEPVFRRDIHGHVMELVAKLNRMWAYDCGAGGMHLHYPPILHELLDELARLPLWDSNPMVDEVRAFIRSRISEQFTVEEMADVAGLSKSHFIRQYRTVTGRTPMEDVRFLRVEEAARLIATSPLPLHEIAPMVGIANVYHLSRLLKSVLGVGVRELRQHPK